MRQIWMTRKGGPEVLEVREVARPEPGPGEVRVRVEAAGVNFADVMMRRGLYPDAPKLPAVAGYEVAGTIDAVGRGVEAGREGRPVVAMTNFVGYSEYVCVPEALAWERPAGVTAVAAAAVPVNYLTAWQMLRVMAPPGEGETVLVHSAAGGVGQAAIQLAKMAGARVLGTASPAKHEGLRAAGLEAVFDSRDEQFSSAVLEATGGVGADVVLEPRNGKWIMESYRSLAKCGRLVLFGFSSAAVGSGSGTLSALRTLARVPWLRINPISLMNDNKSMAGVNLGRMWDQQQRTGRWMDAILGLVADGTLTPVIDAVLPFEEAAEAHRRLEERRNVGKVVLVPDPEEETA